MDTHTLHYKSAIISSLRGCWLTSHRRVVDQAVIELR